MPRAIPITKESPFFGEICALCKEPFAPGDDIVVCNECGTRHHSFCWQEVGNHCTAYGCTGRGEIIRPTYDEQPASGSRMEPAAAAATSARVIDTPLTPNGNALDTPRPETRPARPSRRTAARSRTRSAAASQQTAATSSAEAQPTAWHTRWAQSCLIIAIAIAILVFAFGCFGLWAIADYVMIEVLGYDYRPINQNLLPQLNTMRTTLEIVVLPFFL